jgi:hypothetical protein
LQFKVEIDEKLNVVAVKVTRRGALDLGPATPTAYADNTDGHDEDSPASDPSQAFGTPFAGHFTPRMLCGPGPDPRSVNNKRRKTGTPSPTTTATAQAASSSAIIFPKEHKMYHAIAEAAGNNFGTLMSVNAMNLESKAIYREQWEKEQEVRMQQMRADASAAAAISAAQFKIMQDQMNKERNILFANMNKAVNPAPDDAEPQRLTMDQLEKPLQMLLSGKDGLVSIGVRQMKRVFNSEEDESIDDLLGCHQAGQLTEEDLRDALLVHAHRVDLACVFHPFRHLLFVSPMQLHTHC